MEKLIHGTAVLKDGNGILLLGDSGAGKSDLALRLIDRGAQLIADDQVLCRLQDSSVILQPPEKIAGLIEIRGLGVFTMPYTSAHLMMVLRCARPENIPRLSTHEYEAVLNREYPCFLVDPFEISSPIKVEKMLISVLDPARLIR